MENNKKQPRLQAELITKRRRLTILLKLGSEIYIHIAALSRTSAPFILGGEKLEAMLLLQPAHQSACLDSD